jgi:hypothetical protein
MTPAPNPFVDGVVGAATALRIPPEELATIISFETGGTLDPTQRGPTTKWGQHQGLIQFGQPQAQRFGVDFSSPEAALNSQLGPNGAIVQFAIAHGFIPGVHGAKELYAAINAGNVSAMDAKDEAAGGTPGTVADKFDTQMNPHRANTYTLFGKTFEGAVADATGAVGSPVDINGAPSGYTPEQRQRMDAAADELELPREARNDSLLFLADLMDQALAIAPLPPLTPQEVAPVEMIPT